MQTNEQLLKEQATLNEFHRACRIICGNRKVEALNYAIDYAEAGLSMSDPHEVYVQSLYILNNISHWRGKEAKYVRTLLKGVPKA